MRPTYIVTRKGTEPPAILEDLSDEDISKEIAAGNFVIEVATVQARERVKFYGLDEDAIREEIKPVPSDIEESP